MALAFMAATPILAVPFTHVVTLNTLADTRATLIPGGTGTFTSFNPVGSPGDPYRSGGNTVFWGAGIGQQGIYATLFGTLTKVADLNTAIPGDTHHYSFVSYRPDAVIFGSNVLFVGNGADGSQGIYVRNPPNPALPPSPIKIADLNTAIPGGTGKFVSFQPDPVIFGDNIAFIGNGNRLSPCGPSLWLNANDIEFVLQYVPEGGWFRADLEQKFGLAKQEAERTNKAFAADADRKSLDV
jgi:hypothetical protein